MNKVFLIGNLTKDPELSTTQNGFKLCRFTLAVSRSYGKKETDFIPIVVWRAPAENCAKFLKKGSRAAVSGSLQIRSYDGQDGVKRRDPEIVADEVQFLSTKNDDSRNEYDDLSPVTDDDLPF